MNRPAPAVAACRRRTLLWFPLYLLGVVTYLLASTTNGFNGLALLGSGLLIAGVLGVAREVGK